MILLNLDTFDHFWEGLDMVSAEQSIEAAASIAVWGLEPPLCRRIAGKRGGGRVGPTLRIPVGRGPAQLGKLMTGFARLVGLFDRALWPDDGRGLSAHSLGSTVVVVTPMMSSEIESQLAALIARGRRTVLVPLGSQSPRTARPDRHRLSSRASAPEPAPEAA